MKKQRLLLLGCLLTNLVFAQTKNKDEKEITDLLNRQTSSWNKGNLEEFMSGYWHNDSLMFVGKSGVTYGYANTLNNYKKNYDSQEKMGKLFFEMLKFKKLSADYYWVLGKWFLKRPVGDVGGHYTLLFKKINGKWTIVADHSS
ncbi:MAG: nuclear transport factor 2 family protein [Chitinophagaceae bacterium]